MGWEPEERHEHYDAAGNLTGWTIVTREPEWDDYERNRMLALGIWEGGLSPCGHHSTLTGDKANHFTFDEDHCGVCAGFAQYQRIQASRDESVMKQFGDDPRPEVKRPTDGRRTYIRQMSPLEVAARQAKKDAPTPADPAAG